MVDAELERCERLLRAMAGGGLERPHIREYYQAALSCLENAVESMDAPLKARVVQLESTAMELDWSVYEMTQPVVQRLLERKNVVLLSGSMFCSGSNKLPRIQHDLGLWFRENFQLDVTKKDILLKNVDKAVVALRWLSFRSAIRMNPAPLRRLTEAIAEASGTRNKRRRKQGSDECGSCEAENFHYDLVELLCVHAASGQPGVELKRLKRAESDGDDISVLINERRTGLVLKRFLSNELVGSPYQKLLALSDEVKQLLYYMLPSHGWSGRQAGGLIFAHLLFVMESEFVDAKVQQLQLCPVFPDFHGSKEPMLELYDRRRLYESDDPDVVFDVSPSEGFSGLVAVVNRMCELNEVALERLSFETDDGGVLDVVVGEELLYCGRNSVVLSCRRPDQKRAGSVLKVQPECDSRREEAFHNGLDRLSGIRRKLSSGRVLGAGVGLRFIHLDGFGAPLSASHMSGKNALEVAQSACDTLESVHRLGVLHRDVKPSNFIVVDGCLLLNDFNLSCEVDNRLQRCFRVGTSLFGSPRWDDSNPKGVEYEEVDDWLSLGLTLTYLTGDHRCQDSKMAALRSVASADWAPANLRDRVAAGLDSLTTHHQ